MIENDTKHFISYAGACSEWESWVFKKLIYVQIIKTVWESIPLNEDRQSNRLLFRKALPLISCADNSDVFIHLVNISDEDNFKVNQSGQAQPYSMKAHNDCPFYFTKEAGDITIHFSKKHEVYTPKRFTRKNKIDCSHDKTKIGESTWERPSNLFTLAPEETAVFRVNYYSRRRTESGASQKPYYLRYDAYFANVNTINDKLFNRKFTYQRDETLALR
ncbi:hypothetical protein NBRC116592_03840 [Colwellia sp. KU-HH00111]|uniref:hypothetical protein n=1 Tax=Colwellia sp. KU-HH00111 TaxID=3127652 RepID=UPI0031065FBC